MFLENILRWQGIVEQNISSVLQPAHSKSLISRGLIIYIYLDRQTCQIEMITCRINKADQARVPATIRREPMILSLLSVAAADVWLSLADWWCGDQNMWTIGPLYIVISIAPPALHRSQYLRLTAYLFYIQALHPAQIRISYHDPPCNISVSPGIYDSEGTMWFDYLNRRAITKVIAGRTLLNAEAYVGEVNFKPR